jgi:hypothetical protein
MLNRIYFLILSLVKKSFRYCVYILSRNREKQLCNKTIKTHKKPFWKLACTRNAATLLVTVTVNRSKTVLFLNFNPTDILFYSLKIYTKTIIRLRRIIVNYFIIYSFYRKKEGMQFSLVDQTYVYIRFSSEPTGQSVLIPLGYLHPSIWEHSEVQSCPPLCDGRFSTCACASTSLR